MSDEKGNVQGNWQGGNTFTQYDKMIRESEDYIDELDCESFTREKLVKFHEIKNLDKNKELRIGRVEVEESENSDE